MYRDDETSPYLQTIDDISISIDKDEHFSIFFGDHLIGAIVVKLKEDKNHLYLLFVDPKYQNKGIGKVAVEFIFTNYCKELWTVYTPFKSYKNHHFYEKLGFEKYGEAKITENFFLFKYKKRVENPNY